METRPRETGFAKTGKSLTTKAMSRPRLIALLLAFITFLAYLPVGWFGFVDYDDTDYITRNPAVKHGLTAAGVRWAFAGFHVSNWHPLTWLSHMLDCTLFGLNPGPQHLVNVLFHAVNTALLFGLLWRLTRRIWPSALVAALFAWHPLHVESVAWISERKDVLSAFFGLLTLLSYTTYVKENKRPAWWLALIFFALGLMAKPMLVTLPFVLLLLDYWPLNRFSASGPRREWLIEKSPFFLLTIVSCVLTYLAQSHGESIVSLDKVSLAYRLENAPVAVAGYLIHLFWPGGLCVLYPLPDKIPTLQVVASVVGLIVISAAAWIWRDVKPYLITGWLWFLGMLVPVIGLVQVGGQAMADRYTYLPSIGFFIAVVFLAAEWADRFQVPAIIRFGSAGLASLACLLVTEHQLLFWRDSETLFRRAMAVTQNNDVAMVNLGVALDAEGKFEEAIKIYRAAEKAGSRRCEVYNNLGNVLSLLGRHYESLTEYEKALQLQPDNAQIHAATGRELARLGKFHEALQEFARAEELAPHYAAPHVEAAKTLFKIGRDSDGLAEFKAALRLEPDNYQTLATAAHYLAANEHAAARDGKSALALALRADALSGHLQPVVQDYLGMAYAETGDFPNAITCAESALAQAKAAGMTNTTEMEKRLQLYQQHRPWRESFQVTHRPPAN
jgi:tetratricopeptide (TPR) repeat protein